MIKLLLAVLLVLGMIAFGIVYYLRFMKKPDEYIWVGPGEDPFKEKKEKAE